MVEKLKTFKEFLNKEIELNRILKDAGLGDIAMESRKAIHDSAMDNYIKSTEEYVLKIANDGIEGFLNG